MKTEPVSLLLGVCVLLLSGPTVSAVSLDVRPNRQQFFTGDSVSLSCDDDQQTGGWTVKRTIGDHEDQCGSGFGVFNGSSCSISRLSWSEFGFYRCETSSGQSSLEVHISVTEGNVILEIPALPVVTGSDVTLRCRDRGMKIVEAHFYRHITRLGHQPVRELKLSGVQPSDEDYYSCSTEALGRSPNSWLSVTDPSSPPQPPSSSPPLPPPPPPTSPSSLPPPPPSSCLSPLSLVRHLLVLCPFLVSTGLMLSIYCSRDRRDQAAVSMEMDRSLQGLDEAYDDVTADVTTVHEF